MHIKTNRIALLGLLIAYFLFSSNLTTNSASAASASITTNSSITLDTSSAGNGVSIDEESIGITTTCNKGYNLTIATSTSTDLYLNGDSTKTAAFAAVDGTSALDSTNNTNKWGYTLTNDATASTVFSPLSTTASSIRTISQTNNVTSETIPIYYGIKTDSTIDPGTYAMGNNGTITYYLTMNPLCNVVDIAYDGNNADAGTMGAAGTGVIHTGKKDGDTVNLIASNFSRNGYGFAGWSLDQDAGTKLLDNDNTNNPIVYGPQESVTLPEGFIYNDTDNDGIVKLYAVWLQSQGNLQGWMGCSNLDTATYDSTTGALDLTKNSVTALTDMRDHDTYAVARLADGNCWMIENLRLDAEATRGNNQYDPSVTNESLAQGYGKSAAYGNFSGLADAESTNFSGSTTANSLYYSGTQEGTASIDIGTSIDPGYRMPRYNNLNTPANANDRPQNPTSNTFANNNTTVGMYSYGNYYTWHAAIADLTYNGTDNSSVTNTSLCPSGWHLPKGGNNQNTANNEFLAFSEALIGAKPANYGSQNIPSYTGMPEGTDASNKLRAYPNNFLYSGYFDSSSAYRRGSYGYYWSSTVNYSNSSYPLGLTSSNVLPGTNINYKYHGFSIRCTVPGNLYAIHFDANTTDTVSGTMANQTIAVDKATQLKSNSFQRPATSSAAYRFVKWNTKPDGSGTDYADVASVTNLAAAGQTITLYAQWEQVTPMTVNFNGNGLSFDNSSTTNTVYYDNSNCSTQTVTKTSHTSNINDDGTQIGTTKYNNNLATKDVITIPGATSLHATITYGTENNYDMLYVFQGEYMGSVTRNMSAGQLQKYMGGNNTTTTVELDIPGDTATFAFYSDTSGQYWGYYASVTGVDSSNNPITGEVCERNLISGEYKTLDMGSLRTFYGWSENQSATTADYATADKVLNNLPGNNGETKTLYAIWRNNLTINYNANGGTGTTASQTVAAGETITLKSNSFTAPANMAFGGWNTEPDGTGTSYSANTTFTAPNSVAYNDSLTLYAQWLPQRQIIYNDNCSYNNVGCATSNDTTKTSNWTKAGSAITLGNEFYFNTRSDYAIISWNTERDGSGISYDPSARYTVPSDLTSPDQVTLYAIWDGVYYISFDANESSVDASASATGTMTNQTVIMNTATAIKTNTYALTGYVFLGWNTSTDGTGTFYGDEKTITNLTATGNTITLYAVWAEGAYLDTGRTVNGKLKRLAGNSSATYNTQDNTITTITRSNSLPDNFTPTTENTISHSSSPFPIYAWYDSLNSTIYYYSIASNIIMNKESYGFFIEMRALSDLSTISTWNTVKVTSMGSMFYYAGYNATTFTLDLSSWDTSSLTSMSSMFFYAGYNATTFTLDLSSWNTASVTDMSQVFCDAGRSATTWSVSGLSSWNTSSVTTMSNMFADAGYSATTFILDLSSWNTGSVTNMYSLFYQAGYSATTWSISGLSSWDTSSVKNMYNMFTSAGHNATTFTLDLSSWNTSSATTMSYMFFSAGHNATTWSIGDLSSWNTPNVKNMYDMFADAGYSATTWSIGDLSSWDTSSVETMEYMFDSAGYSATTWSIGDLSSWNTSSVTNMNRMFSDAGYSATSFTLDLSSWDTSSVTQMHYMFNNAGYSATTWSITIPKTNDGTATGPITNTTSRLYGKTTSISTTPPSGRSFTIAN